MMLQPVHALEHLITLCQGLLDRHGMLTKKAPLFINAGFQGTVPSRKCESFLIHSDLLR